MELQQAQENNDWKNEIIKAEKERLLREHLPYIDGFIPKGLIISPGDQQLFASTKQFQQTKANATSNRLW